MIGIINMSCFYIPVAHRHLSHTPWDTYSQFSGRIGSSVYNVYHCFRSHSSGSPCHNNSPGFFGYSSQIQRSSCDYHSYNISGSLCYSLKKQLLFFRQGQKRSAGRLSRLRLMFPQHTYNSIIPGYRFQPPFIPWLIEPLRFHLPYLTLFIRKHSAARNTFRLYLLLLKNILYGFNCLVFTKN